MINCLSISQVGLAICHDLYGFKIAFLFPRCQSGVCKLAGSTASLLVHQVGHEPPSFAQNRYAFFSEPSDFIPLLLVSRHVSIPNTSPARGDENLASSIWCSRPELNRDRPLRRRQLYPFELRGQITWRKTKFHLFVNFSAQPEQSYQLKKQCPMKYQILLTYASFC